ncbi:MAG: site-specific DNA-methyltransferase [Arcobacteraceae bacterium]|jgi:adenine-specific DNA-methyltransferase|nr:site-specific DNA-methyltransferase [Arcobacteraceae bacterium]
MPYIDWMGKEDVVNHHKNIPYKTIECKEEIGELDTENLIIKGDNLLALKSLLPYYASSIKMIYIDPPYNTGNTSWVYNDNMDSPLIKKWLNDTVNAEDLSRSDKWLCMMYPRLKLLRELLKDDGVIFISIDDAEVAHLKMICTEIFGKENFVGEFIKQSKVGGGNDTKYIVKEHEYLLVYSKNLNKVPEIFVEFDNSYLKRYKEKDEKGLYFWDTFARPGLKNPIKYDIPTPDGNFISGEWIRSKKRFEEDYKNGIIKVFSKSDGSWSVQFKQYLNLNGKKPRSLNTDFGGTIEGKTELTNIFNDGKLFPYPKASTFIKQLISIFSTAEDDIILDSFAGSGTTAHAVLEQNKQDGGNRKFILIETMDYAKDITAERVKRVVEGYSFTGKDKTTLFEKKLTTTDILNPEKMQKLSLEALEIIEEKKDTFDKIEKTFNENTLKIEGVKDIKSFKDGIGGGFKYCELSENIFDEYGELNPKLEFHQIAKHIFFVEFKKPITKKEIKAPFVGSYKHKYLYFYENKFLKRDMQELIQSHNEYKQIIVYTRKTTISNDELKDNNIVIRYIPYDIKDN